MPAPHLRSTGFQPSTRAEGPTTVDRCSRTPFFGFFGPGVYTLFNFAAHPRRGIFKLLMPFPKPRASSGIRLAPKNIRITERIRMSSVPPIFPSSKNMGFIFESDYPAKIRYLWAFHEIICTAHEPQPHCAFYPRFLYPNRDRSGLGSLQKRGVYRLADALTNISCGITEQVSGVFLKW